MTALLIGGFLALSFGLACLFAGFGTAVVILIIQACCLLSMSDFDLPFLTNFRDRREEKRQKKLQRLYDKTYDENPTVRNDERIEQRVRQKIIRKRVLIAAVIYVSATIVYFIVNAIPDVPAYEGWKLLLQFFSMAGPIFAVLYFAKTLHDPVTPNQKYGGKRFYRYEKPDVPSKPHDTPIEREKPTVVYKNGRLYEADDHPDDDEDERTPP